MPRRDQRKGHVISASGFEPMVELHQNGAFEGRSTDIA